MGPDLDLAETEIVAWRKKPQRYILPLLIKKINRFFFQKYPGTEEITAQYTLAREEISQDRLR